MLRRVFQTTVFFGLTGIIFISLAAIAQAAGTLYVKPVATGSGTCGSWANACALQTALAAASSGNEIWVSAGTYYPTSGTDRTATFSLKSGVGVFGGFVCTETVRGGRDWTAHVTTLSGDIGTTGVNTDNSYHVVTASSTNAATVLDGFTITKGYEPSTDTGNGGGMYIVSGSPTLGHLVFSDNYAYYNGGGLFNSGGSPDLSHVTFRRNQGSTDAGGRGGGGMYTISGAPNFSEVTFDRNTGGGLFMITSTTTLNNVAFSNNQRSLPGGGMYVRGSNVTLINTTFFSNTADLWGAAISIDHSRVTLQHVTIFSHTTGSDAAGLYAQGNSNVLMESSLMWANNPIQTAIYGQAVLTATWSVMEDGCTSGSTVQCSNIITTAAKLGTFGNYGGATDTVPLLAGSSAIDLISNGTNGCGTTIVADQRWATRPTGSGCDAGAYEYASFVPTDFTYLPAIDKQ